MNYKKIHDQIIERARGRINEGYVERHHIVPKCMGGGDEPENIIELTAREHFVIHQLLVKMYPDVPGLVYAVHRMATGQQGEIIDSKYYRWVREHYAKVHSDRMLGSGNSMYNHVYSEETKKKMRQNNGGKNNPNYGKVTSEETKEKLRRILRGKKRTPKQCENIRQSQLGKKMSVTARENMSIAQQIRQGTIEKKAYVYKLLDAGLSQRAIHRKTGISRSTIQKYVKSGY